MVGMRMSEMTTCGRLLRTNASASAPSLASIRSYPLRWSDATTSSRFDSLSSTTRIVAMSHLYRGCQPPEGGTASFAFYAQHIVGTAVPSRFDSSRSSRPLWEKSYSDDHGI